MHMEKISLSTGNKNEFVNITHQVSSIVAKMGVRDGFCTIYSPHTTAGITINEAADPDVVHDILKELRKIVPDHDNYRHREGNSSAHIKTSMMGPSVNIPVASGRLCLGTWQGIFFCEFDGPRTRSVYVQVTGE